eukprot:s1956_g4.t4
MALAAGVRSSLWPHAGDARVRGLASSARRWASRSSWMEETSSRPVSQETLAGIPWAGRSTLTGLFLKVAENGPRDQTVWKRLTARADVIAHSLTPKQASLILSAMARARQQQETFLRRFTIKFAPSLISGAELIDLCGIISSLSQLGSYQEELFNLAARRLAEVQLDARQLALVANAFVRSGHEDRSLFQRLLKQVPRQLARCTAKDAAILLNAFSQVPAFHLKDWDDSVLDEEQQNLKKALEALALRLPELLPKADLHSLTLILNAFAQMQFVQKDALDLLTQDLLLNEERFERASGRQLAMMLNAVARLQLIEPRLLELLSSCVRTKAQEFDPQSFCVVANAAAKLGLGIETFQVLYSRLPRLLARLSGRQLAMICHAWAKAHIHNDDLFELLMLPLIHQASNLTAHEVAITVYGYAHFRKLPSELFRPLLDRLGQLLEEEAVSEADLLMVANALGRIAERDARVESALRLRLSEETFGRHLSPAAQATFRLQDQDNQTARHKNHRSLHEGPTRLVGF